MVLENTKLLFQIYVRPFAAMSSIIDRGGWLFGVTAAFLLGFLLQGTLGEKIYMNFQAVPRQVAQPQPSSTDSPADDPEDETPGVRVRIVREPLPFFGQYGWWVFSFAPSNLYLTVISLALLYVPGTILTVIFLERLGSFGVVLRRDYGPLFTCTLMAWTAAYLPCVAVAALINSFEPGRVGIFALRLLAMFGVAVDTEKLGAALLFVVWLGGTAYFGFLMACAVRTVFGIDFGKAVLTVSVSWVSLMFETALLALASPFILYWAYVLLRGDIGDIDSAFRRRQSFRRNLELATVNPNDAEAHYQLGLIHQHRRQYTEAVARFKRAVEIDPREIDAHYQLGRIAREQGRLQDAVGHFDAVVSQDDKHSLSEIWREIGATYLAASMLDEARDALERFHERRAYDPEGLYYLGETYLKLNRSEQARDCFERSVEAFKTMPYYRRGQLSKWNKAAKDQLKVLSKSTPAGSER